MTWLSIQLWFLLLVAFLAGAVAAYVVLRRLVPHDDKLETAADSAQDGEY
jgi:phage shock protein PspC (stress-responsive transcriptional regulator)